MNHSDINRELFAAEARGKKHIPVAVFAVILVHIVLFLVLLIAAGCRAKARARRNLEPNAALAQQVPAKLPEAARSPVDERTNLTAKAAEAVESSRETPARPATRAVSRNPETQPGTTEVMFYVVQPGDTVEKIARRHGTTIKAIKLENNLSSDRIRPGQKLRVNTNKTGKANEV